MRVGLVCPYDLSKPGGVQAQVLGLATALRAAGDEPTVIGPGLPPGVEGVDLGRSVTIPGNGSMVPISLDPTLGRIMRSVSANLDVLHVHEPLMPTASLLALRVGNPVVATFHAAPGEIGTRFYNLIGFGFDRILGDKVRAVTAVSETARAPLPKDLDVTIGPNAVDISAFTADQPRSPASVCFLGRDEPRKGLDVLLQAWPEVVAEVPEAQLTVMGAQRDEPADARWMGWVDDATKAEVLGRSTVYVAPNTGGESFGIILLEAMAAGAAVVASDLEAFRNVGSDAVRYFSTGDHEALASAVVGLLDDEGARSQLVTAGLERVKRFDWSEVTAEYRRIYAESLS